MGGGSAALARLPAPPHPTPSLPLPRPTPLSVDGPPLPSPLSTPLLRPTAYSPSPYYRVSSDAASVGHRKRTAEATGRQAGSS